MKAVCLVARQRIEVREVEGVPPAPDEVAIAPEYVGLCGTDLHVWLGQFEDRVPYPAILGHELVGRIAETGATVEGFNIGDRVVVDPVLSCGRCPLCKAGHFNICLKLNVLGIDSPGGLAERVVVKAANLVHLPDSVEAKHGILGELYSVAVHSSRITKIETGDVVVILGAGRLGLCLLDVMRQSGAASIVSVDVLDTRLGVAQKLGADLTINVRKRNPVEEVMKLTGGLGVDKVVEAVGHAVEIAGCKPPMYMACQMLKPGGQITAMGQGGAEEPFFWKPFVFKEATIVSSRLNLGDMPRAVALLASGNLHPDLVITHTISPDEVQQGFEIMHTDAAHVIKVAVDMKNLVQRV